MRVRLMGLDSFAYIGVAETLGDDTHHSFRRETWVHHRVTFYERVVPFLPIPDVFIVMQPNLNLANGMQELVQQAPQFSSIGSRLNRFG